MSDDNQLWPERWTEGKYKAACDAITAGQRERIEAVTQSPEYQQMLAEKHAHEVTCKACGRVLFRCACGLTDSHDAEFCRDCWRKLPLVIGKER